MSHITPFMRHITPFVRRIALIGSLLALASCGSGLPEIYNATLVSPSVYAWERAQIEERFAVSLSDVDIYYTEIPCGSSALAGCALSDFILIRDLRSSTVPNAECMLVLHELAHIAQLRALGSSDSHHQGSFYRDNEAGTMCERKN